MTSKVAILSLLTLCVITFHRADASHLSRDPSHDQSDIVLKISDLRSAYLQRAGVVEYDESNATPAGLRQQLRRHFDVVLTLLASATPDSIELAAVRLEAADDHSWTAQERTAWRHKLQSARLVQLQRLAAYRDRGIFPLNEGQSAHAAPIFVDRHGTACAVGHLMRCSGRNDDVDSIQRSNNLVYVPDAKRSAISAWILNSGLTFEEAALIQPGYFWPAAPFDASAYEPGESTLEKDGLRYSNFKLQAQNYNIFPPNTLVPISTGAKPTIAGLGLAAGKGTYTSSSPAGYPVHVPNGTHWIAVGGSTEFVQSPLHSLNASATFGSGQMVVISFDVAAIAADQRINGISETSYGDWQGFQGLDFDLLPPAGAMYYLKTTARDGTTSVASLNVDQLTSPGSYRKSAAQSFAARQQVNVETSVWLRDGVQMNTYLIDFNVVSVPEPTTGVFLVAVLVATCGLARNRGRTRGCREGTTGTD